MLFNRLLSLVSLLSVAGHVLAVPIPTLKRIEIETRPLEVELDRCEAELELHELLPTEVEVETGKPSKCNKRRFEARSHATRSPVASLLDAQKQLDDLTPKIEEAMQGFIGSIEKTVGVHLTSVDSIVHTLEGNLASFVGDKPEVLYQNLEGTGQMTDDELAKHFSAFFLSISDIEQTVKHVSGYTVTSAQLNIRNDLLSMKKTLRSLLPGVQSKVANIMATTATMGTGVMA